MNRGSQRMRSISTASLRRAGLRTPVALALLACLGCGAGSEPLATVDPAAAPLVPTYDEVALVLDRACVPCHAASGKRASARDGGSRSVFEDDDASNYDTCDGIVGGLDGILRTSVDGGSMPPGAWPRLDERERLLIRRWIDQGACAPCNPCP